jgi:hypothetical protein
MLPNLQAGAGRKRRVLLFARTHNSESHPEMVDEDTQKESKKDESKLRGHIDGSHDLG